MEEIQPLVRVVDYEEPVRTAIGFLLRNEGFRVATYGTARDFLVSDAPGVPGCLVLDFRMPGMNGLELQAEMKRRGIALPVLFLSAHGDIDIAVRAMKVGAEDFIPKPVNPPRLIEAVRAAVDRDLRERGLELSREDMESRLSRLTPRERQILRLAIQGLSNRDTGSALGISEKTVENHKSSIFKRIGFENTADVRETLERLRIKA